MLVMNNTYLRAKVQQFLQIYTFKPLKYAKKQRKRLRNCTLYRGFL